MKMMFCVTTTVLLTGCTPFLDEAGRIGEQQQRQLVGFPAEKFMACAGAPERSRITDSGGEVRYGYLAEWASGGLARLKPLCAPVKGINP